MKTNPTNMILPKQLLAAASADKRREILQGAYVDVENRCLVLCDGRILATLPIPGKAVIKPGYIGPATWKAAKAKNPKAVEYDFTAGTLNGIPLDEVPGNYPNYRQVLPSEAVAFRVCLNPEFIARLGATMDFDDESKELPHGVTFEFDKSGEAPVRVLYGDKSGVIMPCRGGDDNGLIGSDGSAAEMVAEIARLKKTLSERSDSKKPVTVASAASDTALIDSLKTALHAERAKVRELEARLQSNMGTVPLRPVPPVKPLDTQPAGKAPRRDPKAKREKTVVPVATARPVLTRNAERDGIELRFNGKPDDATRIAMKEAGFRWLPGQPGQPWAAKYNEETYLFAQSLAEGSAYTPMPAPAAAPEVPAAAPAETAAASAVPSRVRSITLPEF